MSFKTDSNGELFQLADPPALTPGATLTVERERVNLPEGNIATPDDQDCKMRKLQFARVCFKPELAALLFLFCSLLEVQPVIGEPFPVPRLKNIRHWGYQLQDVHLPDIARSFYDLVVIDYSADGSDEKAFSATDIAGIKNRPDGKRRIILAYLSIGEAEDYRFYWRAGWHNKRPPWMMGENPQWPGNYPVKYWDRRWQKIIFNYLDRIIAVGFDGVYLDRIDSYQSFRTNPRAEEQMISLVSGIAKYANRKKRHFYIVPQNAESLLRHSHYRKQLSAVAKEDFLFGLKGDGKPNGKDEQFWSGKYLSLAQQSGLPVLVIEYLQNRKDILRTEKQLRARHFIPTFSNRALNRPSLPIR